MALDPPRSKEMNTHLNENGQWYSPTKALRGGGLAAHSDGKIYFNMPGGYKKLLKWTICFLPDHIQKDISSPAKPDTLSCYQL